MYNNFSSKKTKKVISALLASALVVTAAPITADAATTKVLGAGKTFTVKKTTSVSGLSKAEKKIVSVSINKKKRTVTVKGLKPGKATFKVGKKSYTVKVGAVKIKKKSFKTTLTAKKNKTVSVVASYGANDTLAWTSSKKSVVKVSKATTKASSKKVATNVLKPLKAGKATITVKSKNTGKKIAVNVTVKAAATTTTTPSTAPTATGGAVTTPSIEPTATTTATTNPTEVPTGDAVTATPEVTTGSATANPTEVPTEAPTEVPTGDAVTATPEVTTGSATTAPTATPEVVTAAAVSASAVNTKVIAVTFNRDLTADEQADVLKTENYSVVKDKATQNVKLAFEDAKTLYIKTSSDNKFNAGTYTVKLTGAIAFTEDVKVDASVVTTLTIDSSTVSLGSPVKVSLLDQYNDSVALNNADFAVTAINKTTGKTLEASITSEGVTVKNSKSDDGQDAVKVNDEIILTLVYKAKSLTATKTLKVVASDYVNKLTFGDVVLPSTDKRLTTATKDLKVMYTATTFYNENAKLNGFGAGEAYSVISSDTSIVTPSAVSVGVNDTTKQTYVKIAEFGKTGTVTLVFVNNKTGETVNLSLTVQEAPGTATEFSIDASEVTIAQGSKAYVGITVKDNYQDVITAEKIAEQMKVASTAGDDVKATIITDKTDANYGKLAISVPVKEGVKTGDVIVNTISVGKASPVVLTVKVAAKAEAKTISATASASRIMVGGTADITVNAVDQYNGEFDLSKAEGYTVTAAAKNGVLTTSVVANKVTVKADQSKSGTEVVTVVLKKGDTEIDRAELTFTVEANDTTNFDYAVKDIPVLALTGAAVMEEGNYSYAKPITVTATKKSDSSVVVNVPATNIKGVTASSDKVTVKQVDGVYYVAGNNAGAKEDVTATLKISVLTSAGYETLEKVVTVSKEQPKATKVILVEKAINAATSAAVKAVDTVTVDSATTASSAGVVVSLAAINQFDVYEPVSYDKVKSVDVLSADGVTNAKVEKEEVAGKIVLKVSDTAKVEKANATIKVAILLTDGSNVTVTIKIAENK